MVSLCCEGAPCERNAPRDVPACLCAPLAKREVEESAMEITWGIPGVQSWSCVSVSLQVASWANMHAVHYM